ncbi:hypothetical protein [uncultured Methylobacterium sp.]|uniref:hypothetical protein n=1 Tax=uncultured Methylobacterium sp. TaxID=157278 RepID=UPI0035CBDA4B
MAAPSISRLVTTGAGEPLPAAFVKLDTNDANLQVAAAAVDLRLQRLEGTAGFPRVTNVSTEAAPLHTRIGTVSPVALTYRSRLALPTQVAESGSAITAPGSQHYVEPIVLFRSASIIRLAIITHRNQQNVTYSAYLPRFNLTIIDYDRAAFTATTRYTMPLDAVTGTSYSTYRVYSASRVTPIETANAVFLVAMKGNPTTYVLRQFTWDDVAGTLSFADLTASGSPLAGIGAGVVRRLGHVTPDGIHVGHMPFDDIIGAAPSFGLMARRMDAAAPGYAAGNTLYGYGQGAPGSLSGSWERVGPREVVLVGMGINPTTGIGQPVVSLVRHTANALPRTLAENLFLPCDTLTGYSDVVYLTDTLFAVNVRANGTSQSFLVGIEDTLAGDTFPKRLVNYGGTGSSAGALGQPWVVVDPLQNSAGQFHTVRTRQDGGAGNGRGILVPSVSGAAGANAPTRVLTLSGVVAKADASGFQATTSVSATLGTGAGATSLQLQDLVAIGETEIAALWVNSAAPFQASVDFLTVS